MLNKILLVCLLFSAGSSLPCRWMDRDFKQYSESALALLQTMKINSTDDIELVDAVAFPNELYKHASKESREERLSFVAHVLDEIHALFEENQTHASWPETTVDDFLNIISQQANGVRRCNVFNISNENFVPVHVVELKLKGLILDTIVGNTTLKNSTLINSQSQRSYKVLTNLSIKDPGLNTYCKTSFRIHTIFVALQMTLNISYLSHMEQLSLETYEYVDCGTNSTAPHPISADK